MGDPRKSKKKFDKPKYPWQMERLEEERKVVNNYGLKNKKELWRMETLGETLMENIMQQTSQQVVSWC